MPTGYRIRRSGVSMIDIVAGGRSGFDQIVGLVVTRLHHSAKVMAARLASGDPLTDRRIVKH